MHLERFITKHPIAIVVICAIAMAPALYGFLATGVNYDILTYLPQQLDSMKGERILDTEFQDAALSFLIVKGMEPKDILSLEERIRRIPGVGAVMGAADIVCPSIPIDIIPTAISNQIYNGDATFLLVKYTGAGMATSTQNAIAEIRRTAGKQCYLSGASALLKDTKDLVDKETPLYVVLAVVFSVIVLSLTMESILIPFVFLIEIGVAVLFNFGTNIVFGQISYITKALAAVLQLGVTMDFSIFLLNRYEEERGLTSDHREAMAQALHKTFLTISGGALTEMAGFLSLCAMTLTLGSDIGVVMAKGVFFGLLCTMTLLPSLILLLDRPLHATRHRPLLPTFKRATGFITRHPRAVAIIFVLLFIPALYGNFRVKQYYNLVDSLPDDMDSVVATNMLKADFNMTTTHFILIHDEVPAYKKRALIAGLDTVDGVNSVLAYEKIMGPLVPEEMIPDAVAGIFHQSGYELVIANSIYKASTDEENAQVQRITSLVKAADPAGYVTGEGVLTKDLIQIAAVDFKRVDWVSIVAIFLIIMVIFGSLSVPVLMVAGIELSIFLNVAFSFFTGETIPFIASIVIGCIQLGVTIDYAILLVTRFREELRHGKEKGDAMRVASEACSRSIVTSALTLFAATFGVGLVSQMAMLRTLCMMIARGALISMVIILFIMPAIFVLSEKVVAATSLNWRTASRRRHAEGAKE